MKHIHIIGIDPGKSGGIARIRYSVDKKRYLFKEAIYDAYKCPKTIKEMVVILKMFNHLPSKPKCFLESVHAFPTDGRSSAFKFGMNFGIWQGILTALDIETILVTPQKWQKHFGELPKIKKDRKNKLKEIATERTKIKATLNTADALCIALYGYENSI
jgi:hypothetical protein